MLFRSNFGASSPSGGHVQMDTSTGGHAKMDTSANVGGSISGHANVGASTSGHMSEDGFNVTSGTCPTVGSHAATCVTLPTDDRGIDEEVQSTLEGFEAFVPKTPFLGMKFDSHEEAHYHYNKYAKFVGFSVKILSSRKSVIDKEKDKVVYV